MLLYHYYIVQVHENDVWGDKEQPKWIKRKVEEFQYPPKIILDVTYDEKKAVTEMIKFTLHFSGIQETGCSKSCDKTVNLYAKSNWFIDNNDQQSKYM